jgi:hypothetical protein
MAFGQTFAIVNNSWGDALSFIHNYLWIGREFREVWHEICACVMD